MEYNPDTGVFTWLEKIADKVVVGSEAGSKKTDSGYRIIRLFGARYRAHRLAFLYMTGRMPEQVDHMNHVRDDNRWVNLRECDYASNGKNHPKTVRNATGVVGVSQRPDGKFVARIYVNKKHLFLGAFNTLDEAAEARSDANKVYGFHENHGT